ncbi:asparaginase [Gordonia insulae]|uniref:asparaginase n=1 Tax=Gordonia insulae TaxID=2420509 RepID=A0A3G8JFE8_9ACTN|nr:asparaginase [Gordonia insulae]AZG43724.1 putative L-asparaginase [Gordonia insulae]
MTPGSTSTAPSGIRIVLITTGGTIAAQTTADGAVPRLSADDLRPASTRAEVDTVDLMSVDSSAMTVADQFAIVAAIVEAQADPGVDGVVITHGTDTLEESAYLADLFVTDDRPVVFTGAQFPADTPASDGPANVEAAFVAATDPANRGRGVLVALGGEIRSARGIFKGSTTHAAAFDNVHDDLPRRRVDHPLSRVRSARVDTFALYPGVSPGIIAAAVSQQASGIVLAATGSGNTHPDITAEVNAAVRAGIVVVVTSRVPYGAVDPTYGGGGGAVDLERAGAIVSRWLRAPQARMALLALLSTGATADEVREFFRTVGPD